MLVVHDPAHLRQSAIEHVSADRVGQVVGIRRFLALIGRYVGDAMIVKRIARSRSTALIGIERRECGEILHAVVAVIIGALVNVPAQAGLLQGLPVRLPGEKATHLVATAVSDERAVLFT